MAVSHPADPNLRGRAHLPSSIYILCVVLIYASLATFSWVVICVLTYKPVNAKTYTFNNRDGFLDRAGYLYNEEVFRGMRVIQAIVSILTIPITSVACSCASMVLADRGWTNPTTFGRLVSSVNGYKRIGSRFLLLAMALNINGGLLQPLQQVFIPTTNVKIPGGVSQKFYNLLGIPDQSKAADGDDNQLSVLVTRDTIATTKSTAPFTQLWHEKNVDYDTTCTDPTAMLTCGYGGTLSRWSWESNPFLAELPSTFNSGPIRQFAPRLNSSASYEPVDPDLYPQDCADFEGSFVVRYESNLADTDSPWSF